MNKETNFFAFFVELLILIMSLLVAFASIGFIGRLLWLTIRFGWNILP